MEIEMKGLWLEKGELKYRDDIPDPELTNDEALIKVLLAGVCSTDIELVKGYYPFCGVLGHEFVGQVIKAPTDPAWEGKRVVGEINAVCGECEACKAGRPTHCENRTVLGIKGRNGVFAEYCTLPVENLHEVPPSLPNDVAVFTEPLAAAMEIHQQVRIHPSDRVVLIGAGRLGMLIAFSIMVNGCELKVVARRNRARRMLKNRGIMTIGVEDIHPRMADIVIDATGNPEGFLLAKRAVRPRGKIILKSTYKGSVNVDLSSVVVDEITLIGSRCGPFAPALKLLENAVVNPIDLIDGKYQLSDSVKALEKAGSPGVLKILIDPTSSK